MIPLLGIVVHLGCEPSVFNNRCRYTAGLTATATWKWKQDADSKPINQTQIQNTQIHKYTNIQIHWPAGLCCAEEQVNVVDGESGGD